MASTPLTDAELLAYIERTPECATCLEQINPFNRGYWVHGSAVHGSAGGYMPYKYKEIARAFHAHEQRVREEEREACAKVCEKWAQKLSHGTGYALRIGADAIRERGNYESTAPQLSTAADRLAPSPEGAGQGEAAEAIGRAWFADEPLPINFNHEPKDFAEAKEMLKRMRQFLIKQGGK